MLSEPIIIETERLLLRRPIKADFDAYAANMADPHASRYIGGPQPRAVAWRGFLSLAGAWLVQGFSMFSVIEKSSGQWVGRLGPWHPEGWPGTEIGWALSRAAWGKGYAYEGAVAAIDWAFEHLGWHEIVHSIDNENLASQALAQRLGSHLRGPARLPAPYELVDAQLWCQTREQWQARQR